MMPLHYVRHERCAVRPCYDGLRAGAASERPTPTHCANASACLSWPKRQKERERERERPDNLADRGPSARRTAVRQLAHTTSGGVKPTERGRATGPLPRR